MLYVFHVDVGRMMSFDMTVALSSVDNLKHTIERLHGITAANIVLLVSGGEMLTHNTQVSFYSAGTDTNPIYMFLTGDFKLPPAISQQTEVDLDLREQVERCLQLPAVYETVLTRAQLASRLQDLAREEERVCERLVHDQHLQQQGWSAVVANMEDLTGEFKQRCHNFFAAFDRHLEQRARYLELLRNFGDDLAQLARIPILPGLMVLAAEDFHGFDDYLDTDEVFARSQTQQESVLMTAADEKSKSTEDAPQPTAMASSTAAADNADTQSNSAENITESSDDKNSTSPNKKLKMGNERGDDDPIGSSQQQQQQTTDIATTTVTTTATATITITTTNATSTTSIRNSNLNLLQWITSKESHNRTWGSDHNTLKLISDECIQGLSTFNEEIYDKLKTEMQNIIKLAEQNDVKEIKGISERLCRLEDFKYTVKKMVQDQKELSMSFQLNQNRVSNVRDPSVLPDLCESHKSSLNVMMQKHNKILEHRRCIAKAKDELGSNLHMRLKRIVWLENAMSDIDNRLLFYHRCLRRAEKHITIIEQIHQTPCIYVAAVTEVVRRKIFSGEFRQWASKLAEDFDVIHSEEIKRRQLFNSSFEGHFLNILFPGMSDMPPAFANETPLIFDARLPNITRSDIDLLSTHLPNLASQIELPDMGPVINFFVSRSGVHQRERMEELLRQQVAAVMNNMAGDGIVDTTGKPLQPQRLNELQKEAAGGTCCDESETDTETEFEKVVASMQTVSTSTSENQPPEQMARSTITEALPLTQSAATLTDETSDSAASARAEVERLRGLLAVLSKLTVDCLHMSRANIQSIRHDAHKCNDDLQSELQILAEKLHLLRMQSQAREHELNEHNAEQQQELDLLRNKVMDLEREMFELRLLKEGQDSENCRLEQLQNELQERLKTAQEDREHAIAVARDEMRNEHETEIESLRCRFKLMTSMEASTKCADVIDVMQHEAMMAQLRSTLESEKERAISAAIEIERSLWQSKYSPLNSDSVMVKMLEDKERQLEQLREKDIMLTKENFQLKARLDALTNEEGNSWLMEKIEYLRRDKTRLEEELTMEKSRRMEMETSLRSSINALPRSKSSGSSHKYIVLDSCAKDDIVFVVWSMRHRQFMVVQDSPHIYFVHGDSLAGLNLRLPRSSESGGGVGGGVVSAADELPIPLPYYAIGRVVEKEYCQARKDENRYRVSKGSKFYRIKLVPLSKPFSRRDRMESFSSSISRSISQCESQSESVAITGAMTSTLRAGSKAIAAIASTSSIAASTSPANTARYDVVDAPSSSATDVAVMGIVGGGAGGAAAAGGVSAHVIGIKERTISITSVTEEDDEPVSLLGEHCRYISVSEEDEPPIDSSPTTVAISAVVAAPPPPQPPTHLPLSSASSLTASTTSSLSKILQQSVITEQPTALSTLKRDLLLASADIIPQQEQSQVSPQQERDNAAAAASNTTSTTTTCTDTDITSVSDIMSTTITDMVTSTSTVTNPTVTMTTPDGGNITNPCTPSTMPPSLVGTAASEDSDEYRSLEAKDDTDFPISE